MQYKMGHCLDVANIQLTMVLDVSLVSFLIVTFLSLSTGQQGVQCGQFRCAEFASCVGGVCLCISGYRGAGRFLCVQTANTCPCISFGDPHTVQFDGGKTRSLLPCQFVLSGFTVNSCDIQIETVTKLRLNPASPFRTFNGQLKVKVIKDNTELSFTIGPGGSSALVPTTIAGVVGASADPDLVPVASSYNTFSRVTLTLCNVVIAYDNTLMAATVSAPNTLTLTDGFCRNCNGNPADDNQFLLLAGVTQKEADLALSMRELTNEQSTGDGTLCTLTRTGANQTNCMTDATLIGAVRCCDIYYDDPYAACVLAAGQPRTTLLEVFANCISQYCGGSIAVAASLSTFFAATSCILPAGYTCV